MTFTPKIIHHDEVPTPNQEYGDDGEELELPDELAALAGELARDANRLTTQFPPADKNRDGSTESVQRPKHDATPQKSGANTGRTDQSRYFGPALSIVLAALLGVTWMGTRSTGIKNPPTQFEIVSPSAAEQPTTAFRPRVPGSGMTASEDNFDATTFPASFVRELTGPELEVFLDILHDDETATRLSI